MKFTLRRIRLNIGGYEYGRYGQYFGSESNGALLYRAQSEVRNEGGTWDDITMEFRATDRAEAKRIVSAKHPSATF